MSILCYHAVEPGWHSALSVPPALFDQHCAYLSRRKTVVPLDEALRRLGRGGRLPRGLAALTFDDGFRSVYDEALPLLQRYRLPATVFLVAQTLTAEGQEVDWVDYPPPYPMQTLTIDQIETMAQAGVAFESHSMRHLDLTALSFDDCVRDLRDSRELLESLLRRPVKVLAYPRGRHNQQVRDAAARAGYSHALALPEGPEPVGPYAVPRVGVHPGNGVAHLRIKTSAPYQPVRTGALYQRVRAAKRALANSRR